MIAYLNSFALHYERLINILGSGFEHIVTMNIRNAIANRMQRELRRELLNHNINLDDHIGDHHNNDTGVAQGENSDLVHDGVP